MFSEKYPADLLSGIAAFVQVGQSTSFTEAARRLNISASGVSRSMSRLEERLGARLINRTTRHLSLTPEGALYFERCRQILKSLEEAAEALGESRNASEGRLSVRLPKSFGRALVIPALAEYSVRYPKISLDIRLANGVADMEEEGIDVAMHLGQPRDAHLVARKLCSINYVLCASPDYLRRHGTPRRLSDLANHRCLTYIQPRTNTYRDWELTEKGATVAYKPQGVLNVDDVHALLEAAIHGAGIVYCMDFLIRKPVAARSLRVVLPKLAHEGPPAYIVAPPHRYRIRRVREFIDFLFEILAKPASRAIHDSKS